MVAVFPFVTNPMFFRLGFAGGSSLLGGVAMLLTGVPWVLVIWGERIRARSRFAKVRLDIFFTLWLLSLLTL